MDMYNSFKCTKKKLLLFSLLTFFIALPVRSADYYIHFINGGGNVSPSHITVEPNDINFEVDGIKSYKYSRWYVNGSWKEDQSSGITAVDPDYTYNFSFHTCKEVEIKCVVYNDKDHTSWNSTYKWYVTVTYNTGISPATYWRTISNKIKDNHAWIYRIYLKKDKNYIFKTGCGDGATANFDTYLNLYNSSCGLESYNNNSCENNRSKINFKCSYTGYYYLRVFGYGGQGGSYTLVYKEYIEPPTAYFSASPRSGYAPLSVQFTDKSTGNPTSWKWDFGDGYTSSSPNPRHTYSKPGKYSVKLRVTNDGGGSEVGQDNYITVSKHPPVADFSASPRSGTIPLKVQFADQSQYDPTSWSWNFGDGSSSNSRNPSHTYSSSGIYTVKLTVSNSGGSDRKTKSNYITVTEKAPIAEFSASPRSGTVPLKVQFTDQSQNNPTSWKWDFGDGNTSTSQNPSHTYSSAGTYTVSLTVSNNGGSDSETKSGYITVSIPAPIADFSASPTSGTAPLSVQFTDQSHNNPTSWKWDFGDGNTSTSQNPSHTYNSVGTYTVSLTVSNNGGSDSETKSGYITVSIPAPIADFSASPTSGTAPLSVQFTDQSQNNPTSWKWDFGDGTFSNQQNPNHTFNKAGVYTIKLTVSNNGGSNTKTKNNYINVKVHPPKANFSASPTNGNAPLTVQFTDKSEYTPTSWTWDFGDGNTSNEQNPTHTYNSSGNFTVSLTVSNNGGDDTKTKNNYIVIPATTSGIENLDFINYLKIYPNPNHGEFSLEADLLKAVNMEIKIFSVSGELVYNKKLKNFIGIFNENLNMKKYSKGIYYLQLITTKGTIIEKIIIQ